MHDDISEEIHAQRATVSNRFGGIMATIVGDYQSFDVSIPVSQHEPRVSPFRAFHEPTPIPRRPMRMTVSVDLPQEIAAVFGGNSPQELSRNVLEALVLEGYREDRIGAAEACGILGLTRLHWNHFLKRMNVLEHAYSIEALERDVAAIQRLRSEGVLPPL